VGWATLEQWNIVRSLAGVLRGVHAHSRYDEYYVPIEGRMFLALRDARRASSTFAVIDTLWVGGGDGVGVVVPAGVAHGVYFETDGVLVYGLTSPWSGENEYGCRWDDRDLAIAWPTPAPILSPRDRDAGTYQAMVEALDGDLRSGS
jgi:dTDP-4-dehydrorhamnose 3,5-epimerase